MAEGQGTYGPLAIYVYKNTDGVIHFIFVGVDEHGKTNQVDSERCQPVNPPANDIESGGGSDRCVVNLGEEGGSWDGEHSGGFDIWWSGDDLVIFDDDSEFVTWTEADPGLPDCVFDERG